MQPQLKTLLGQCTSSTCYVFYLPHVLLLLSAGGEAQLKLARVFPEKLDANTLENARMKENSLMNEWRLLDLLIDNFYKRA